ncbi:unnamed protein product [Ceutorhynchus assimilis]|uniref:Uncharacterized protein n=1 Tax=Ceutorhynchus assimilis TaxID=467358 RepID=A0A9N9MFQ1_9CUCU|nr:unnamed protein product [Ceutorhynchus assimilis]
MDVKSLTKEEFLKFLNCSHHSVSTKRERIVVSGPQNQKLTVLKQFGNYTASQVQLEECALNHQVLRVPLPKVNIERLPAKQVALKFKTFKTNKNRQKKRNVGLSRFGRKLKRKLRVATRASPRRPIQILQKNTKQAVTKPQVSNKDRNTKPEISNKDKNTKTEVSTKDKNIKFAVSTKDKNTKPLFNTRVNTRSKNNKPVVAPKNKNTKPTVSTEISTNNNYKTYQNAKKLNIIGNQTVTRSRPKQTLQQQMASMYKSLGQQAPPSPIKPQFIIKYVPSEPTYFLKMGVPKEKEDGLLKYPFESLVKDIKNMKLPSTTWKIKVVVKNNKIASIIFTNKCVLERTVSFDAVNPHYEIVIENKPAILLGSPNDVGGVEDIEILLNIIHTIDAKDCMIFYKD